MTSSLRTLCLLTLALFFLANQPIPIVSQTDFNGVLDIAVVIDVAASTDPSNAVVLQEFLRQFSHQIGVSEDGSHIGVINVGESANTLLRFGDGLSIESAADSFASIESGEGDVGDLSLNLGSALQKAYDDIFSSIDNRPEVPDVVVIVTDGHSRAGGGTVQTGAVATAVVGVGDNIDVPLLNSMDSSGVADFAEKLDDLRELIDAIRERLIEHAKRKLEEEKRKRLSNAPVLPWPPAPSFRSTKHFLCKPCFAAKGTLDSTYVQKCGCSLNDDGHVVPAENDDPICDCCTSLGCPLGMNLGDVIDPPIFADNPEGEPSKTNFYCKPCFDGYTSKDGKHFATYKEICGCERNDILDDIVPSSEVNPQCDCCSKLACEKDKELGDDTRVIDIEVTEEEVKESQGN